MIQINLLPENLKESAGPSSMGFIAGIFVGISLNFFMLGVFGYLNFMIFPELKNFEKQLEARLDSLKRKTKDYDSLKKEKESLEKKTNLVRELIDDRILWSNRLQDLSIFTNDRRVWFSSFKVKETVSKAAPARGRGAAAAPAKSMTIILDCFAASRELNIPNDYRKDIVLTDWWKEYFLVGGINDPSYEIKPLPETVYKDEFYHTFMLELRMSPTSGKDDKTKKPK